MNRFHIPSQRPMLGRSPQIHINKPLVKMSLAIALANATSFAMAQSGDSEPAARVLEEIVVTARRREESLQDIPVAVSALDSEALRAQNVTQLNDLGTQVPSFRVSTGGSSTNEPVLSIRGQRPTDSGINLDAAIPIYFADVVMTPSSGTNLSMYDLQSVQVLKGPQGTLFGRNSTGGALLISPQKAGDSFAGYIDTKFGNYNSVSVEAAVDLPLTENLAVRLAGQTTTHDGYQENKADNNLKDGWDEDSQGLRLSVAYQRGIVSNDFMVGYDENEMVPRLVIPAAFNPSTGAGQLAQLLFNSNGEIDDAIAWQEAHSANEVQYDTEGEEKIENTILANTTELDLSDNVSLKNIFGYRKMEWSRSNDADGSALPLFTQGGATQGVGIITRNQPTVDVESEQFTEELQLLGSAFDSKLDWLVGAYWYQMEASQRGDNQVLGPNPDSPLFGGLPVETAAALVSSGILGPDVTAFLGTGFFGMLQSAPAGDVDNSAYAIFAEGTYTFTDQWSTTLGLRQSWDTRAITVRNYGGFGGTGSPYYFCSVTDVDGNPVPSCAREEEKDYSSPTARFSINYTPADGHLIYAGISTGYRAGGFNLRGFDNETLIPFDEESVVTYEVGHKANWGIGPVPIRTNLALYWQSYEDIQKTKAISTNGGGFGVVTVNAGKAAIAGFEYDMTAAVTDNLQLSLAYSYVDAGYDEWNSTEIWADASDNNIRKDVAVDLKDSKFVYMPEQTLTASIKYDLPIDSHWGELSLYASLYWQDEMYTDETSILYPQQAAYEGWSAESLARAQSVAKVDAYNVYNLRFDWRSMMGSKFDMALYVNNASDEEYIVGGVNVIDSLGWAAFTYGAPRTFGASLRYEF
ncbi:TonB-dependent receptor [Halioxenophilus sp. WMMB6]|uniref:TonB-dependent receptor n=1 Tax=Halioxenophilus sp. WMMB6 TaxID=3073815 RepID=UPI00295ED935|nr:TonB-dependent receptor [Halioxenophilus sp. WMMB6]